MTYQSASSLSSRQRPHDVIVVALATSYWLLAGDVTTAAVMRLYGGVVLLFGQELLIRTGDAFTGLAL